ncbi:tol-pal system protein YbgF [Rhodobium orientis]|nr:tol-pal system protein YbgF [Rhodobium orientis]MBB4303020.1 tol-pal system protein YbgF [Rhodobium orientis]
MITSGIRHRVLPVALSGAMLAILGFSATGAAASELESPIILAQGGFFGSSSRENASQSLRMSQLEEQIRKLTGQVEDLSYQVRTLTDQLQRMQQDNEFRFQQLENPGGGGNRSQVTQPQPQPQRNTANNSQFSSQPQSSNDDQTLGTMVLEAPEGSSMGSQEDAIGRAIGQPLDLSTLAGGNNLTAPGPAEGDSDVVPARGGDPRADYDVAYGYILSGDYARAETAFRNFLDFHGDDDLAVNARFWLGESLFGQRRYQDAADVYLAVYTEHPTDPKAPDALFKLGQSLKAMGETGAACATYSEVLENHGSASQALRSRVTKEMRGAGCKG